MPTPEYVLQLRQGQDPDLLLFLPGVCGVVLRDDLGEVPHVLFTQRTDTGRWALPAGIVEPGEQPATTLARELVEETRVEAQVERLAWLVTDPVLVYPHGDRCQFLTMVFRCRYLGGEAQVGDEESSAVRWFPVDALPELEPVQHRRIAAALSDDERCRFET